MNIFCITLDTVRMTIIQKDWDLIISVLKTKTDRQKPAQAQRVFVM